VVSRWQEVGNRILKMLDNEAHDCQQLLLAIKVIESFLAKKKGVKRSLTDYKT
jgi:hypothetical protein